MTALDELREAIGLVDGLRLAGTCLSRASVGERTRALVARRSALAAVEAEWEELDHILASVDVPHALNGRMQPLAMRARAFVARSNRLAAVEAELAALRETNQKLNRRCQSAEAGLAAKLTSGPSFGRALANAAATMYHAQLAERNAELVALRKRPTLEQALEGILGHMGRYDWGHRNALGCATNAIRALYGEAETGEPTP